MKLNKTLKTLTVMGVTSMLAIPAFATNSRHTTSSTTTDVNYVPEFTTNNPIATQHVSKSTNLMPVETDDMMYRNMTATWSKYRDDNYAVSETSRRNDYRATASTTNSNTTYRTTSDVDANADTAYNEDYGTTTYTTTENTRRTTAVVAPVDNTRKNKRDANYTTLTAEDQARGTKHDVEVTRMIRRELVKDDSLSTNAKNVKIITLNNKVTLRGPVETQTEKMKIERKAEDMAGSFAIDNQLEVINR